MEVRHDSALLVVMLLAFVVSMPVAARAAWNVGGAQPFLMPDLDRSTRRLIQQGLRNEGFDPGTPDGLFGPGRATRFGTGSGFSLPTSPEPPSRAQPRVGGRLLLPVRARRLCGRPHREGHCVVERVPRDRRAEERAARWPPGTAFRDCEMCRKCWCCPAAISRWAASR